VTAYERGADFERKVKDDLMVRSWFAVRSAGSHGKVDILAYHETYALFIQCKKDGAFSPKEKKELLRLAKKHSAVPLLADKHCGAIRYRIVNKDRTGFFDHFSP